MSKTYTATDINGNEVVLSSTAACAVAAAYDRECHKDDILMKLESFCEDEGLDVDKITDDTVEAIVDDYEDSLDNSEDWVYHADNAIDRFANDVRNDCERADAPQPHHSEKTEREL